MTLLPHKGIERIFRGFRVLMLSTVLGLNLGAEPPKAEAGTDKVRLVSSNLGLVFIGDEPVKVGLQLQGPLSRGTLDYAVDQLGGEWKTRGSLPLAKLARGTSRTEPLALSLPGPGLYRVHVQGALGSQKVSFDRNISLLTPPPPVQEESPWGIFYCPPSWFDSQDPKAAEHAAASIRTLGASWVRFGFWADSFGNVTVTPPDASGHREVKTSITAWKENARALHAQNLHILGNLGVVPRALSSQPQNEQTAGDGGPQYGRVKPADYALWEQFIQNVARTFKDEIEAWEIGNEPDNHGVYFYGTPDEFGELVQHTSRALRRENPALKIAGSGFTRDPMALNWGNRLLEIGMAKEIDYFSVHYTDREAVSIDRWQELLRSRNVHLPIWNTEENSTVPLFDRIHGLPHSFKFLHVNFGYETAGPLVEKDYTLRPEGMEYAMGVRCLGTAKFLRSTVVPGGTLHLFQREREVVGVYQREPLKTFLDATHPAELHVKVTRAVPDYPVVVTTSLGRVLSPAVAEDGQLAVGAREPLIFINGCSAIEPLEATVSSSYIVAEAEEGTYSSSWHSIEHRDASSQHLLELWTEDAGGPDGHRIEMKLNVPAEGTYEVLLASSPLAGLKAPREINAFTWSIDGQPPSKVDAPPALAAGSEGIEGGLNLLGKVELKAGPHVFLLKIAEKRETTPQYRLSIDAVALRKMPVK